MTEELRRLEELRELKELSEVLKKVIGESEFQRANFQEVDLSRLAKLSRRNKSSSIEDRTFWKNVFMHSPNLIFSSPNP
jgi:hypothetical protein